MKQIGIYEPFVGSETQFIDSVPEGSREIAQSYWFSLNSVCLYFIIAGLVITIGLCVYYFTAYNKIPGRHYKPIYWAGFYIGTILLTFIVTLVLGFILTKTTLNGTSTLVWNIAMGNAVYSFVLFGLLSVIWWLCLPTNAYRLLKRIL